MKKKTIYIALTICVIFLTSSGIQSQLHIIDDISNLNGTRSKGVYSESSNGVTIYEEELYVTGTLSTQYHNGDIFLHKYDKNGNIIWGRTWGIPGDMEKESGLSVLGSNGEIFVLGLHRQYVDDGALESSPNLVLLKYEINGNLVWNTTVNIINLSSVSSFTRYQENIYVTGSSGYDVLIIKFDLNGNLVWENTWKRNGYTNSGTEIHLHDGIINIIGNSHTNAPLESDIIFLKYDINGNYISNITYTDEFCQVSDIAILNGSIYASGTGAKLDDFAETKSTTLYKLDFEGNMLWNKTFDNSDFDSIAGIDSLAGNLFLIGNTASDFIIMKIDSNGTLSETKNWEGTRYSEALDIISTNDSIYIIGNTLNLNDTNGYDTIFLKYDTNIDLIWNQTWGRSDYPPSESAIVNISMVEHQFSHDEPINVTVTILNHGTENISRSGYCFTFILEHDGTSTELFCPYNTTFGVILPRGGVFIQTIDLRDYSSDLDTWAERGNLSMGDYSLRAVYGSQDNPWYNETDIPYDESTSNTLQFEVGRGDSFQTWIILIALIGTFTVIIGSGAIRKRQKK